VENSVHWVMDVQMSEDQQRARADDAAENLGLLHRLALNLLRQDKRCAGGIKTKQLNVS
jgi:predicted transposase YbfD/YdcC